MTISIKTNSLFHLLQILTISFLGACGGGGGDDNKPVNSSNSGTNNSAVAQDTTPGTFNFTASTNAATSVAVTSPAVTISGINTSTPVSISGGEYSINGGAFTSAAGTITNGQTLAVRITASDKTNTPKEATITVGGVSAKFTVTTAADVTPDAFTFSPKNEAAVNTEYTSDSITVKGIDIAVPVSITGGTYSINGGAYTASAGTVSADQTITVKATSGGDTETTQNAVLTVGGVTGTFAVTTIADTTPPVAEFKFPTPYTMSEASEVKVRGTATDDHAITSVKLVIRSFNIATPDVTIETKEVIAAPKSEANGVKDFSSWTATIPLTATAENEIKVVAIDDRENEITVEQANKVVIRQADVKSAFPDEINQFVQLPQAIALDKNADRNRILVSDQEYDVIYSVNLDSGQRTTFIEIKNDDCSNQAEGLVLDATNNKLYAFCNIQPKTVLLEYNLISGELENSYATSSDTYVYGGALDRHNGRNQIVFATHIDHANVWEEENGGVYAFNLDTKTFSIISAKENQQIPLVENRHIVVNGDQYLLTSGAFMDDAESRKVISVDALTGSRNVLSSNAVGAGELFRGLLPDGRVAQILGLYVQPQFGRVLVSEVGGKLFSINLKTGDRTVFKQLSYAQTVVESLPATRDIDIDTINDVAYIDDNRRKAILIFDLETQEKVILSKSKNNF